MPLRSPLVRFIQRPRSIEFLIVVYAILLSLPFNLPFWSAVLGKLGGWSGNSLRLMASFFVVFTALHIVLLVLLSARRVFKPALTLLLLTTAATTYFMSQYGIVIDTEMISNVFATDSREVQDLLTGKLALYVVLLGGLPAWLLWKTTIQPTSWRRALALRSGMVLGSLVLLVAVVMASYQGLVSVSRNNMALRSMVTPLNYIYGIANHFARNTVKPGGPRVAIGEDARQVRPTGAGHQPRLIVVVVGETARADHFSPNGYARQTNPQLAALAASDERLINFGNLWSCGTATAVSLPCMFSNLGRANFSEREASQRENLVDVAQRAGVRVSWINNNSGCKGLCGAVPSEDVSRHASNPLCSTGECFDEILVEKLVAQLKDMTRDTLLILHQKGSHGPAYYKRYPKAFEKFSPVCENSQLDRCDVASIVNAYDNTIAYTDLVLAQLIGKLKAAAPQVASALIYASDHGESLGEGGLFLHGMPYALAPDSQKHVPSLIWFDEQFARDAKIDTQCLQQRRNARYTHDNLFHSVLGLLDVETKARDAGLDLLAPCRKR